VFEYCRVLVLAKTDESSRDSRDRIARHRMIGFGHVVKAEGLESSIMLKICTGGR